MAQQLRSLANLAEDLSLVSRIYMEAHNSSSRGPDLGGHQAPSATQIHKGKTFIHIKISLKKAVHQQICKPPYLRRKTRLFKENKQV